MIGFIHALRYAREPARASRPVLVRFDSKYAALCGSGVWKGKKNKKLVATARAEWKATADLKRRNGVGFWLKHVKGHSGQKWNDAADSLATRGLAGERHRVYLPREVD
jgi:ribonuclease HI